MRKFTTNEKLIGGSALGVITLIGGYLIYNSGKAKRKLRKFDGATYGSVNVIETARQLGLDLGTAYSWFDPRSTTENDDAVNDTLLAFPKELMPQLRQEYSKLFNRDLQADCQKLLDDYAEVSYLFK